MLRDEKAADLGGRRDPHSHHRSLQPILGQRNSKRLVRAPTFLHPPIPILPGPGIESESLSQRSEEQLTPLLSSRVCSPVDKEAPASFVDDRLKARPRGVPRRDRGEERGSWERDDTCRLNPEEDGIEQIKGVGPLFKVSAEVRRVHEEREVLERDGPGGALKSALRSFGGGGLHRIVGVDVDSVLSVGRTKDHARRREHSTDACVELSGEERCGTEVAMSATLD